MNEYGTRSYWLPAASNLFDRELELTDRHEVWTISQKLEKALGVSLHTDYCTRCAAEDFPLEEKMVQLLEKLKGPHGQAILKMHQLQHDILQGAVDEL